MPIDLLEPPAAAPAPGPIDLLTPPRAATPSPPSISTPKTPLTHNIAPKMASAGPIDLLSAPRLSSNGVVDAPAVNDMGPIAAKTPDYGSPEHFTRIRATVPGAAGIGLTGPEQDAIPADPLEAAALAVHHQNSKAVRDWFDRHEDIRHRLDTNDHTAAPEFNQRIAGDPFPMDSLRKLDDGERQRNMRDLQEGFAQPLTRMSQQIPAGWHVGDTLAAKWGGDIAGSINEGAMSKIGRVFDKGLSAVGVPDAGLEQAWRETGQSQQRGAEQIRQNLPQTTGAELVTGQVNMLGQLGASMLLKDPKLAAAAFTGMFATEAAGTAWADAKRKGHSDAQAYQDATFSGFKAAIISRLPIAWPALARETAAVQMSGAYVSGTGLTTGDAIVDEGWKHFVRGEPVDANTLERVGMAFLTGGAPAAGLHGAHLAIGAAAQGPRTPDTGTFDISQEQRAQSAPNRDENYRPGPAREYPTPQIDVPQRADQDLAGPIDLLKPPTEAANGSSRNPAQERPVASGLDDAGASGPVETGVGGVVGQEGAPPIDQPGNVGGAVKGERIDLLSPPKEAPSEPAPRVAEAAPPVTPDAPRPAQEVGPAVAGDATGGEGGGVKVPLSASNPDQRAANEQPAPEETRFPAPEPRSTDTIATQKNDLRDQLRHIVATSAEYHDDLLHQRSRTNPAETQRQRGFQKSATVGQRVAQGNLDPKALVDLETAKDLARKLPEDHPAQLALKKLEALEGSEQKRGVPEVPPTSIKNEVTAQERAKRELPEAAKAAKRGFGEVWDNAARDLQENPDLANNLVDKLKANPRAMTDHEDALLLHRQIELQNLHRKLTDQIIANHDSGGEDAASLRTRLAAVSDQLLDVYNVGKTSGTETARGLNARKIMAKEDYSLAAMETSKRAALGGRELTPAEHEQIKTLNTKVAETQKAFDDYVAKAEVREAELRSKVAHGRMRSTTTEMKPGVGVLDKLIKAGDAAGERLRKKFGGTSTTFSVDAVVGALPDATLWTAAQLAKLTKATGKAAKDLYATLKERAKNLMGEAIEPHFQKVFDDAVKMHEEAAKSFKTSVTEKIKGTVTDGAVDAPAAGRYIQLLAKDFVKSGITDREKLIDAVHAEVKDLLPDWDRRQTMDAISGYGAFKQLSKDEVAVKLRDLKGQMQQVGKLEDMQQKGQAPLKTGVERREPSAEERRLIQQVNQTKKKLGIQTTDPETQLKSTLDGVKTRLKNQIEDIEHELTAGQKTAKESTPTASDAGTADLRAKLKELRTVRDAVFGDGKEQDKAKSLTDAISKINAELAGAETPAKAVAEKSPDSPHVAELRARLKELKEQKRTSDAARIKQLTTANEREIKSLSDRITLAKGGVFKGKAESSTPPKALEAMTARRDALRAELEALRAADPAEQAKDQAGREKASLSGFKSRTANRIAELADKMAREDYAPAPVRAPLALDTEGLRLRAENERMKLEYQRSLLRDRLRNRTFSERAQDALVKVRRAFVLSSPVTLGKLAAAAVERMAFTPIEEVIGGAISKAAPGLARLAPREGGFSMKAEGAALAKGVTDGMKDAFQMIKNKESDLTTVYGSHKHDLPPSWLDYLGQLHGALKSPTKRNEFARSLQKRTEHAIASSVDVHDPLVLARLAKDAYVDANRSIFMQDNRVVDIYKGMIRDLERPNKETGRPGAVAKGAATGFKVLLPIVKVPTNVVAETIQYATGLFTGGAKLAMAYKNGVLNLRPEEADHVMRLLKKGSIGAAAMALGYFNPTSVGGYYQQGEKRDEKDVKAGGLRLYGYDIPRFLVHNPLLEALQIGSTIRRVMDSKHKKSDKETQGAAAGVGAAVMGLIEEVPFYKEMLDVAALSDSQKAGGIAGRLAESALVPAGVSWAAEKLDKKDEQGEPVKRKPQTIAENIKMGIPGLRQQVPEKVQTDRQTKPRPETWEGPLANLQLEQAAVVYQRMSDADKKKYAGAMRSKFTRNVPFEAAQRIKKQIGLN